jgi:hypothetical protein
MRTGGVEPPQREAAGLQPVELSDAQRPRVSWGGRSDLNRYCGTHNPGCWPLHHGHQAKRSRGRAAQPLNGIASDASGSGDDRARTGGLSPDKRVLCATELRPQIEVARVGFEPTSRAHEAREAAAPLPRSLAGRNRTCDLRFPTPVGWPTSLQPDEYPRRDSNPQPPG